MTVDRAAWRDFICAPDHPYRHLSSLGSAVLGARSEALDVNDLSDFLDKLSGDNDFALLADMVDLLGDAYSDFFGDGLHRLLDRLTNQTESRDEIVGPGLRGNPRWDRTLVGRISGQLPPGRYQSRVAHRSFALPENLLLKWLVNEVAASVRNLVRRSSSRAPHPRLSHLLRHCDEASAHHWFSQLAIPPYLTPGMVEAAKRSRLPEYRAAAILAERRANLTGGPQENRWYAILMLLAVGWLEPISDDDLFELYALSLVLDVIASELEYGQPDEYGLVTSGRRHVAAFRSEKGTVRVLFDQNPAPVAAVSTRYRPMIGSHKGLSGSPRRPDITIMAEQEVGAKRRVIVEIKRSENERYISDSIYKVFAYLFDFAALWDDAHPDPKAILVVPEGISRASGSPYGPAAVISGTDRTELADALRAALS